MVMWRGSEYLAANYRELYEGGGVRAKELAEFSRKEDNNFALTAVIVINIEQMLATIPVAASHLFLLCFYWDPFLCKCRVELLEIPRNRISLLVAIKL